MKHSVFIKLISVCVVVLFAAIALPNVGYSQSRCTPSMDADTLTTAAGSANGYFAQCKSTPDAMKLKFYKLALCKEKPTYSDESKCVFILNNSSGVETEIAVGVSSNLFNGDISIPEGTYKYAMLLIDNTIAIKKTLEFDTGNEQFDGRAVGTAAGKYCWTNGKTITWGYTDNADQPIHCGSSPEPSFSSETFYAFGGDNPCTVANKVLNEETLTTFYDIYLLSNLTTQATVDISNCMPTKPNDGNEANYIWGVQTFKNPPTISANTKKIDLGFQLTDGMNISFNGTLGNCRLTALLGARGACVQSANVMGFAFTMKAE